MTTKTKDMSLGELITELTILYKNFGNLPVVVDMDEDGYYRLQNIKADVDEDERRVINLISSNEV